MTESSACESFRAYRASQAQLRMWFAHRLEPTSPYYNSSLILQLRGRLDTALLEESLRGVIGRHDALRTNFVEQDGDVLQLVSDEVRLPFTVDDAAGPLHGALAQGPLLQQLQHFAEEPFDLERDPLLRTLVVRLGADDHLLALTMHHIVVDGWSMGPLLGNLASLYRAAGQGCAAQLPELEIQYGDFAEWQRENDDSAALQRWCERLKHPLPTLDLPTDCPRGDVPSTEAGGRVIELTAETTAAVRSLARAHGVTSYVALLACFSGFLGRLADQPEIIIGTPSAGRSLTQVQPLIGYFVNTLPMRIDVSGAASLNELVSRCATVVAAAFADEDVALERIVEAVRPPRRPGRSALFDVLFTVQSTSAQMLDIPGIEVANVDLDRWWTRYDLEVNVWDKGSRMRAMFVYRSQLFTAEGIDSLIAQFERHVAQMLAHPECAINLLPSLRDDDLPDVAELEAALIRALPLRECRVECAPGCAQVDVVAVPEGALDEQRVTSVLSEHLPFGVRVQSVTLLAAPMPRDADGAVDTLVLANAPAVRRDSLQQWHDEVRAQPQVLDAHTRIADDEPLLRHVVTGAMTTGQSLTVEQSPPTPEPATALAIVDGGPAPQPLVRDVPAAIDAAARGDRGVSFIDACGTVNRVSYRELRDDAMRVAAGLHACGIGPDRPVLLRLDCDYDTVVGLWAAILAGVPAVPLGRPSPGANSPVDIARRALSADCVVLDSMMLAQLRTSPTCNWRRHQPEADSTALLLLTSGSTGTPKVVPIRHRSIVTRSTAALAVAELAAGDVTLNWMPLDHVGGVVMSHLRDVIGDCEQVQVDTGYVLADPLRWITLAAQHHVVASWAPHFAFGLVADRASELGSLDLSGLRYLLNGGEAIVPSTARAFLAALRPHGLPPTALRPAWGMSETCSGQTDSRRFTLETTSDGDTYASVGKPYPGFRMRIVDEQGEVCREGIEGALEVSGIAVIDGYLGGADQSAFTADGWFRTGDLALVRDGELTITARLKDVIVVNGQNRPCHELEVVAESVPGMHRSFVAATAVRVEGDARDRVAVFYHHGSGLAAAPDVRRAIVAGCGVVPDLVVPLELDEFPKTSIGKIQRSLLRARLESGDFDERARASARLLGGAGTVPDLFHRPTWTALDAASPRCAPTLIATTPLVEQLAETLAASGAAHTTSTEIDSAGAGPMVLEIADLAQAQALVSTIGTFNRSSEFIVLLRGCWVCGEQDGEIDPERAAVAAYLRSAVQELPGLRLRVVELVDAPDPVELVTAATEICLVRGEPEVAVRSNRVCARRLVDAEAERRRGTSTPLQVGGRYLVTGGTGGVGALIVRWLVEKYRAEVTVVARHDPAPQALPDGVRFVRADVREPGQLREVLRDWRGEAVFHLAGAFAQAPAAGPQPDDAWLAKVAGARALDELLADRPETTLVLFSSVNGFYGASAAATYAAANGALDALADARAASGRSVRSIAWSAWGETGASADYERAQLRARRGFYAYERDDALEAFELAMRLPDPVLFLGLDSRAAWTGSRIEGACRSRRRFVAEYTAAANVDAPVAPEGLARSWVQVSSLSGADDVAPSGRIQNIVIEAWRQALDVTEVRMSDGFFDQGGASLQMARLHGILQRQLQRDIPMVELFRHTTVRAMAAFLEADGVSATSGSTTSGSAEAVSSGRQRAQARRERRGRR